MKGQRRAHVIEHNKGNQRPTNVVFFDCETDSEIISENENAQNLKVGWACYKRSSEAGCNRKLRWAKFTTPREFWNFVELWTRPGVKLYLVAHNIGFDFRIVSGFDYVKANGWELTFFYNKGKTCLITYRKGKKVLQLIDLMNLFPMSLKALGDVVGVGKGVVDFESVTDDALSRYCKRDVEIMIDAWELWLSFLDEHDLGNFKQTLPSQAFNAFRHRFMTSKIFIHKDEDACNLERDAYRGGRTEVFWQGSRQGEMFYQLDVNSMYAFVMAVHDFPTKLLRKRKDISVWRLRRILRHSLVIARVTLQTDLPAFPIYNGVRNIYPVGVFQSTLSTPELLYSLERDMILAVHEVAWYKQEPIFREYSTYFTGLKDRYDQAGNKAFRKIAKLFLNSLYGKFGQRGMETKIMQGVPDRQIVSDSIISVERVIEEPKGLWARGLKAGQRRLVTSRWGRSYRLGNDFILEKNTGEAYNSFPAIAAHVTAYARIYLWELIELAGRKNTFYTDTDCLMVNQKGYDNLKHLLDDHKSGLLKIEAQADTLTIHAPKDYELGDKSRIKGIRKNAVQVGLNTYEQDQFLGLAGAIRRETPDLVTIKRIRKRLGRTIKTGHVGPDGWVTPFRLSSPHAS